MQIGRKDFSKVIKLSSILTIQSAIVIALANSVEEGFEERLIPIILVDLLLIALMILIIDWGVKSINDPANFGYHKRFILLVTICSLPALFGVAKSFFYPGALPYTSLILPFAITLSWFGNLVVYFRRE